MSYIPRHHAEPSLARNCRCRGRSADVFTAAKHGVRIARVDRHRYELRQRTKRLIKTVELVALSAVSRHQPREAIEPTIDAAIVRKIQKLLSSGHRGWKRNRMLVRMHACNRTAAVGMREIHPTAAHTE